MRLLADENVARDVVTWLRTSGHEVLWAAEIQSGALDSYWASMAERDGWTVLTADKDFGEIVYRDRTSRCGIILLRFDDLPVSSALVRLKAVWSVIEANAVGRFIVVTETRIRVRALPYSN